MKWTLLLVIIVFFSGCTQYTDQNSILLDQANNVVENYPDSALQILKKFDTVSISNNRDCALYYLLLNQSQYKLYQPATTDSMLNFCVDYYSNKGDKYNLCRAYYYNGVILYEKGYHKKR